MKNSAHFGKVLIQLDSINSTNNYAKLLLSKSKPAEGTVICADFQTGGRGQFDRTWESEAGKNLLFSVILYPTFLEASKMQLLSYVVALSLKNFFLEHLKIETRIKPPNDIYFEQKKLAGILIENSFLGNVLQHSVVGIGMNVNQKTFDPALPNPTSIANILQKEFELLPLLKTYLPFLEKGYGTLINGEENLIEKKFKENLFKEDSSVSE